MMWSKNRVVLNFCLSRLLLKFRRWSLKDHERSWHSLQLWPRLKSIGNTALFIKWVLYRAVRKGRRAYPIVRREMFSHRTVSVLSAVSQTPMKNVFSACLYVLASQAWSISSASGPLIKTLFPPVTNGNLEMKRPRDEISRRHQRLAYSCRSRSLARYSVRKARAVYIVISLLACYNVRYSWEFGVTGLIIARNEVDLESFCGLERQFPLPLTFQRMNSEL